MQKYFFYIINSSATALSTGVIKVIRSYDNEGYSKRLLSSHGCYDIANCPSNMTGVWLEKSKWTLGCKDIWTTP